MINLVIKSKKTNKIMKKISCDNIRQATKLKQYIGYDKKKIYIDMEEK